MRDFARRHWPWFVLLGAWYAFAAARPWLDPDEGRYAEIPREMLVTGDWETPHLNGIVYLEKPPLQYWATAAVYSVMGVNEFSSRFYALTLTLLAVPLAFVAAKKVFREETTGRAAAVALATSPYFLVVGQLNLLDGAFATLLGASVVTFILAQLSADPKQTRAFMLMTWAALAAALLQKGIVVFVLCGATLVAYSAVTRDLSLWRKLHLLPGLAVLLAISSGWFVVVAQRNPGFLQFFFVHEHFQRFLTTVHERTGPWWYFIPILVLALLPWLGQVLPSLKRAWSQRTSVGFRPELFLLLWCGVVVVFFSASGSKLAPYVMPCIPFLAVLLAPRVAASETAMPRATYVTGTLLLLLAIAVVVLAKRGATTHAVPAEVALWSGIVSVTAIAGIAATRWLQLRGQGRSAWRLAVACAAIGWPGLMMAYTATPPVRTTVALANTLRDRIRPTTSLYFVGQFRHSLPPYLGRTLRVADFKGELEYGLQGGKSSPDFTLAMFEQAWARESDAVAFVSPRAYGQLLAHGTALRVIGGDDRTVVIEPK